MRRFHTIATHARPHLDEAAAIWLLRRFGEENFPGIGKAEIIYWSAGGTPDGRSAEEYEEEGTLLVGIGGGRFDEHATAERKRRKNQCAAKLVAEALGIHDDPSLRMILQFVLNSDTRAKSDPFDLAALINLLNQQFPDEPDKVMEWAFTALEAKYREQQEFHVVARRDFRERAEISEMAGPKGKRVAVVTVPSDSPAMNKFARSPHGCQAAVVIQRNSSGNVQIFTDKRRVTADLRDLAAMLRWEEQRAKGEFATTDWQELRREGKVAGAEEWFYHLGGMLLNGSLTAREVPPTKLSLKHIRELVCISLNPRAFEASHARDCERGVCSSSRDNPCPWYSWGLGRCRAVRYHQKP